MLLKTLHRCFQFMFNVVLKQISSKHLIYVFNILWVCSIRLQHNFKYVRETSAVLPIRIIFGECFELRLKTLPSVLKFGVPLISYTLSHEFHLRWRSQGDMGPPSKQIPAAKLLTCLIRMHLLPACYIF